MINIKGKTTIGPNIITDGLILNLDAANPKSYPGNGNIWYDISGQNAHAEAINLPNFVSDGSKSYFNFDGVDDEFHSVDISQEYRDIFVLHNLSNSQPSLPMLFGKYDNQDRSLKFSNGTLNSNPNSNDWHYLENSEVFINGNFNAVNVNIYNNWSFVRAYRSNNGFNSSFRYEISSSYLNRRYSGYLSLILCYNRKLNNDEVIQNYNSFKNRFNL